jgi:WD40 repeat protein/serine/threonine protein kinase
LQTSGNPIEELFSAALEITEESGRIAYLRRACGDNVALQLRLLALLQAHEEAKDFLLAPDEARASPDENASRNMGACDVADSSAIARDTTDGKPSASPAPQPLTMLTPFLTDTIGDYRILREIGRGGMGIVYEAEQVSLGRRVALKLLPRRLLADDLQRLRFQRESRAAAALHHANIVPVFGVGEHDGLCYYVMQFIPGCGLDAVIRDLRRGRRSSLADAAGVWELGENRLGAADPGTHWRRVAQIGLQAADALQHAHERRILHRDIKPSNILLDSQGWVWITDFGLAKAAEQQDVTCTGDILGTLRYLPPEALDGGADARSDVYSLGLTLYELLSLRPAFPEKDRSRLIKQIACEAPLRLERLNRKIPLDLATIIHKAIERHPAHRFQSAGEMAADLRRFLEDKPIRARRLSLVERFDRWSRRNPGLAGSLAIVAALVMLLAVTSTLAASRFHKLNQALSSTLSDAHSAKQIAEAKSAENADLAKRELAAAQSADRERRGAQQQAANLAFERGVKLSEQGAVALGMLWMARSLELLSGEDPRLEHVIRTNLSGWSTRISPLEQVISHPAAVHSVAFSGDGKIAITAGGRIAHVWDVATGRLLAPPLAHDEAIAAVAINFDGTLALTGSAEAKARIWDVTSGQQRGVLEGHTDVVRVVLFSPDGRTVLTGGRDGAAQLWDVASGRARGEPLRHGAALTSAMFTPDGKTVVTVGGKRVQLWDAATSQPIGAPLSHSMEITSAVLSRDGQFLLTGCGSDELRRGETQGWSLALGQTAGAPLMLETVVSCVALSPDGRTALAGGRDGTARCWSVEDGKILGPLLHHGGEVKSAAFSPDGAVLLTGSLDGKGRLWNVASGALLGEPLPHQHHVWTVAFSPDGQRALTGSEAGFARLWNVSQSRVQDRLLGPQRRDDDSPWSRRIGFSPNGAFLLTGDQQGAARIWDVATAQPAGPPLANSGKITALAFRPDGALAVIGCDDGSVRIWNVHTGDAVGEVMQHDAAITELHFSPDGRFVLTGSCDHSARLWDASIGHPVGASMKHPQIVWDVKFSHDGATALTSCGDGSLRAWQVPTGESTGFVVEHSSPAWELFFRRDDRAILAGSGPSSGSQGEAFLWDAATGQSLVGTLRHQGAVSSVAFSPSERLVATGSFDGTAQLWDAASGQPVHLPLVHQGKVWDVDFSPDGEILLTASDDQTVRLWDVATGKPLGPPLAHPASVHNGCMDDQARLWRRPTPLAGDTEAILMWTRIRTGMELDPGGVPQRLEAEQLAILRARLAATEAR